MELDNSAQNQTSQLQIIHPIHDMDDSKLIAAPVVIAEDIAFMVNGKRKRGRPPRGQAKPQPVKTKQEEEDVCFICFDGGSLVLCDRRGCPKAYHPSCVKRDETFFRSKARWNCGWHICSVCQKSAHYMCYTCTYSLCKACTKDADYVCVRGDKGFCMTCMRTVMLIENNEQGNKEKVQVDFDDKSSWEYLFKVYWIYLKGKLSLTLTELAQAKNPWKAAATTMGCKGLSPAVHCGTNDGKRSITNSFSQCLKTNSSKRMKMEEQLKIPNKDSLVTEKQDSDNDKSLIGHTEWATKELLEFVAHMKNGDTSVLSQFDVQALLLEYIKINNLRDPHRKSQIICDSRLKNMFYKPRVGHFEMLKLLEYHFFIKEEPRKDVFIRGGVVDAVASQVEADGNNDNLLLKSKDKKRKTRRKGEERVPQTNLEEYAAIDVHNINLIYLRRNLMESLIDDSEKFHEKVVGSIVRIRISSGDQKQDMYRLVQVVGTTKVAAPYKSGNRTSDVTLKVLNLDKKEDISIDAISNQDFSEEECRRLRQSIRCGLVKQLTVGEILQKAMALQTVKLNDWLETEILRLTHLRDRASEKGRKKEYPSECVEKLQLLKTPEERQSRLREIPEVHSDPNMDPNYQSDEDAGESNDKKQDEYPKPRYSAYCGKVSKPISPRGRGGTPNDTANKARKISTTFEFPDKEVGPTKAERVNEGKDEHNLKVKNEEGSTASLSKPNIPSAKDCETDKLWHYRDPNGRIQGPFSMVQLQKWSTTGYFPPDMRIWGSRQEDSVLLTDALNGQLLYNISLPSQEDGGSSVNEKDHNIERLNSNSNHGNRDSHETTVFQTTGGRDNENQSNTQGSSGQSSGQNWKPLLNGEADIPDLHSPTPTMTSCGGSEGQATENKKPMSSIIPVQDSDITDLPSPTPKTSTEDQKELAADNKLSVPSNFPAQDSNPSWSSASSLVLGGAQLPDIADEWGGYSPTPPKPCAEEWDSGPTSVSSPKPHDSTSDDRVATPTSTSNQLTHSFELIEFSTLAEESVSDLLAEVDAMESQGGLASPTSVMICGGDDFIYGPKDDCFSSIEEFSSTPDPGKSDALSSTQSTITDEPVGSSQTDFFERSNGFTNLGWGDATMSHHGALSRNVGWEGQQNYDWGGQRFTGLKDRDFNQDSNSGLTKGNKGLLSKQPFGGGVEGGYSRPPPKGRVCKFYESGHCKKGAFCSYLHQ